MNLLITGGCGYVGTHLVSKLLENNHKVKVVDTQWFGNYLENHPNLQVFKANILKLDDFIFREVEAIIHLANIANDPAVELDPTLSWEVNVLGSELLISKAVKYNIKQFIYASSGSVYGINAAERVTEDLPLLPISVYNKTKMVAERVLLSYQNPIDVHCIRPATICGYSKKMRLDLTVNLLTFQALMFRKISVFGGQQTRPNININDMIRVYEFFLANQNLPSGCYNAGFENLKVIEIAEMIKKKIDCELIVSKSNDPRSYRQDSSKIISFGFKPNFTVNEAIDEIMLKFNDGSIQNNENYYTVKTLKKILKLN